MKRRTKIVATIGPSSRDKQTLHNLIQAGMNVARLNFSHGTYADHAASIADLRHLSNRLGVPLTILQDLQGPKIRTADLGPEGVMLVPGELVVLVANTPEEMAAPEPRPGPSPEYIPVDFPDMPRFTRPGARILLADGQMELQVRSVQGSRVGAEVIQGGLLKSHKGVNLPGAKLDIPGFTEKDEEDLAFGLSQGVDAIAISFVRTPEDVARVRMAIARLQPERMDIPVIAKLERPEALDNLEAIVQIADGVMVARGDLGVEMSPEEVPIAQKRIIECANRHAKIVITATQMLESMMEYPRPTRAEASDVANAIFDGTDAVMLSGETAAGKYPVKAVEMMAAIVIRAEENLERWGHWKGLGADAAHYNGVQVNRDDALYLARAASELAHDRNVAAIAVFSKSGRTTLQVSKTRPGVPVIAFTPNAAAFQRINMYWGVSPHLIPKAETMETMLAHVEAALLSETSIQPGQQVVLICGFPISEMRPSNLILLHTVGR